MDRALNSDLLTEALGHHSSGALPTVEELTALIAEVEVRAFIGPAEIDDLLLQTAWYLHGVASAKHAERIYTESRQERAFAVSAHIFDLALGGLDHSTHERLTLAFGAQIGYRRGGQEPNATAIWRRVDDLLEDTANLNVPSQSVSFGTLALRAGVAFLGLDIQRIQTLLTRWLQDFESMRTLLGQDTLASTMFGPAEAITQAVRGLVIFLRNGDRGRLQTARNALLTVLNLEAGQGDHDAKWVATHLLEVTDGLDKSSIWTVLPDGSPPIVAQAFTVGTPPVLTLWPPQRELLTRKESNPLDPATRRMLLSVPTSAGKTLIAQLLICHHIETQPGNVCYITPLRSLGREMRQALKSRLRVLQKGFGADLPDFGDITIEELLDRMCGSREKSVDVLTPERLSHLLRQDPASVLNHYTMFVIDEAHLLAQPGRGLLLETILTIVRATTAKVILLSGVMGNAHQIATWLNPSDEATVFESGWRGPRRLHALLYTKVERGSGTRLAAKSSVFTHIERYPITADIHVRPAESVTRHLATSVDNPIGFLDRKVRPSGAGKPDVEIRDPFYKMCARTAREFLRAGSLLMILSQRLYTKNSAQELAKRLPVTANTSELCEFLEERLGIEHPLIDCVRHGVAYHHAGLPVDVLDELEQAMREESLCAMFATSTLTDGVNLPVRTVIICETRYEGQDPGQQFNGPRLLNAVGRAGRAGKETEGWIILGLNRKPQANDFEELSPTNDDLEIVSTLNSDAALLCLAKFEELVSETADALFTVDSGEVAYFAAHIWFILSAQERLKELGSTIDLSASIDSFLAFAQLPPEIAARWKAIAEYVRKEYELTDPESRLRWTLTGTTLSSARRIEGIAINIATTAKALYDGRCNSELRETAIDALTPTEALRVIDQAGALTDLLALPEGTGVWKFKPSVGAKSTIEVPVNEGLKMWLAGSNMTDLAAYLLPEVTDTSWRLEQTVDAVSGTFEHFLSWTIGVVIAQANERLANYGEGYMLPDELAYFIRYGVDTPIALSLLTSGIRSRRLAYTIGQHADKLNLGLQEVRDWLCGLHINGWKAKLSASSREVEDLIEFCRSNATSPLRQLLEQQHTTIALSVPVAPVITFGVIPVELHFRQSDEPIEVWSIGANSVCLGTIAVESHADVMLLEFSGLNYLAESDGTLVTLREIN